MSTHHKWQKFLGKHVHCHTHFGTFQGVVVHCTKHHIILGRVPNPHYQAMMEAQPVMYFPRQMPMGPGPGGGGWGGGGWGGGGGGGWHIAIPLAAILGITAVGMHWW